MRSRRSRASRSRLGWTAAVAFAGLLVLACWLCRQEPTSGPMGAVRDRALEAWRRLDRKRPDDAVRQQPGKEGLPQHPALQVGRDSAEIAPPVIDVYFSPRGGCTDAIVGALDGARQTVLVQAYSFTSAPIAKALVAARDRGVDVRVLLDASNRTARYTNADFLARSGVPAKMDDRHAIAHDKVMIIDGVTVITGSFNFSHAAETKNAENLLVISRPS